MVELLADNLVDFPEGNSADLHSYKTSWDDSSRQGCSSEKKDLAYEYNSLLQVDYP